VPKFKTVSNGRYIIQGILGEGGVARVHRCYDRRTSRECAIKLLLPPLRRYPRIRDRFEREAEVLKSLTHDNIVQLYDHGITEDHHWLVMELVPGGSLVDRVRRDGPFDWERVVAVGLDSCAGLRVAHDQGIIHRDIKPGNLLMTQEERVKIVDFGICHVNQATRVLTTAGVRMGSVRYMAPEQRDDAANVGAQADVYGLGITMLALLLGRTPKRPEDEISDLQDEIPASLAYVLLKATLQEATRRYESVEDMSGALLQVD
jgi:serine/threonine-protein kinase